MKVTENQTQNKGFYQCKSDTCLYFYDFTQKDGVENLIIFAELEDFFITQPFYCEIKLVNAVSINYVRNILFDLTMEFEESRL